MANFSPFYSLYGQEQEDPYQLPYGDMFRPRRNPYEERIFPSVSPEIPQTQTQPSFMDAMSQIYNRQTGPAMSAYSRYLQTGPPKESEYAPSKMRRLGAILSGAVTGYQAGPERGMAAAQNFNEQPYRKAIQRYQMAGEGLKEAAGLEDMMGQRQLQTVKMIQDMQQKERDDQRQDMLAESLIHSRNINMQKAIQDMQNAGLHYQMDQTTGILNMIRADGSITPIGKFNPSTGEKTQSDREEEEFKSKLIEQRQRNIQGLQQTNAISMEGLRQQNREKLKGIPSATDKDKPTIITPAAQRTATVMAVDEVLNSPEFAWLKQKGIINQTPTGYEIVKRPTKGTIFGASEKEVKDAEAQLAKFEAEVKKRAAAKMNMRTGGSSRYIPE